MNTFKVLEVISKNPDLSQKAIAEKCDISVGKVNYTISQLLNERFIDVKKLGKKHQYFLTDEGKEYLKRELEDLQDTKVILHTEEKQVKNAVILAAGSKTEFDGPVCLTPIGDTTLLERMIQILERNGIENIVIVTGYKGWAFETEAFIAQNPHVQLVHNSDYLWTGSMASLAAAKKVIDDDFILIEDDVLIEEGAIVKLLQHKKRDCILVTKESGSGDEAYIEIRNDYLYKITKDIHQLNRIDGEMIGITKLSLDVYVEMLENYKDNKNPLMHYEYMLLDVSRQINIGYLKIADLFWAEVDNRAQLQVVKDKVYPMLLRKEAMFRENEFKQNLVQALSIKAEDITEVKPFGGMTNKNYKVTISGEDFVVRVAGTGTDEMINRSDEKVNSKLGADLGLYPELLYFDDRTGLKIARLIPNAETLNPKTAKRQDNLNLVNEVFKTLHHSGIEMKNHFDIFGKLAQYEQLNMKVGGTFYDDYEEVKENVMKLRRYYEQLPITFVSCHNDTVPENFVKSGEDKLYLIDWEYGGMNDPMWDISTLTLEGFTEEEENLLLEMYLDGEVTTEIKQRMIINKIYQDFLWTVWTLYKEACGDDFGPYGINRYNRAKQNIQLFSERFKGVIPVENKNN